MPLSILADILLSILTTCACSSEQTLGLIALIIAIFLAFMIYFHFKNRGGPLRQKLHSKKFMIYLVLLVLDISKFPSLTRHHSDILREYFRLLLPSPARVLNCVDAPPVLRALHGDQPDVQEGGEVSQEQGPVALQSQTLLRHWSPRGLLRVNLY